MRIQRIQHRQRRRIPVGVAAVGKIHGQQALGALARRLFRQRALCAAGRGRLQVQALALVGHGIEGCGVLPRVGAHHLVVDPVFQDVRTRRAAQHVVKPLEAQRWQINKRYRIHLVAFVDARRAGLHGEVVVRSDQQGVIRVGVVPRVFVEVVLHAHARAVEIAGDRQYGNVDAGELVALRGHRLPVGVVGGVFQPAREKGIRVAIDGGQVAVGATAAIPVRIQSPPAFLVAVAVGVQGRVGGGPQRPRVQEIEEDVALHRDIDARRGRGRSQHRLQRGRAVLGRGPLGEAVVAVAVHAHAAVAPRLPADPVDRGGGVFAVVFIGYGLTRCAGLAAAVDEHAHIAVCGRRLRIGQRPAVIDVDGEAEQHRLRRGRLSRPHHQAAQARPVRTGDDHVAFDDIAPGLVLGQQVRKHRQQRRVDRVELVQPDQFQRVGLLDARLAALLFQRRVEIATRARQIHAHHRQGAGGLAIVQAREHAPERRGGIGLATQLRVSVDFVLDEQHVGLFR